MYYHTYSSILRSRLSIYQEYYLIDHSSIQSLTVDSYNSSTGFPISNG